jgi:tetratricopeptide (TPR) repeat protein
MTRRIAPLALLLPALALLGAAPVAAPPDELIRQGNGAVSRQKYADALKLYERAEERATDPGLVAFNEGVALYQQGDYARAELQFRLARQDAVGRRRLWASYNLASSLVQGAGDRDAAKLAEAISLLEACLSHDEIDDHLAASARHNLELAKVLWLQARARPNPQKDKSPQEDEDPKQPPPPKPQSNQQPGGEEGSANSAKGLGGQERLTDKGQQQTGPDGEPAPGEGTLPVIPDREELVPMSREEAEAHLRQAIEAVMKEGRTHRQQRSVKAPSGKVRDW